MFQNTTPELMGDLFRNPTPELMNDLMDLTATERGRGSGHHHSGQAAFCGEYPIPDCVNDTCAAPCSYGCACFCF